MVRYPDECPVFVADDNGFYDGKGLGDGSIVVGVRVQLANNTYPRTFIGVDAPLYRNRLPADCSGWCFFPHELRPLTRAAREMLAIAKAGQ